MFIVWDPILLQTVTSCLWSRIFLDTFLSHICYFISITVASNPGNFASHTNVDHSTRPHVLYINIHILTGLVTSYVETAFYKKLLKER